MRKREVVYISGPITGIPNGNVIAFAEAEGILKTWGYKVLNPHRITRFLPVKNWLYCMLLDLWAMRKADAIYYLRGWDKSIGCKIERLFAEKLEIREIFQGDVGTAECADYRNVF